MKRRIYALVSVLVLTAIPAIAEEKILTASFPSSPIDTNDNFVYCKAILGTVINGRSKEYEKKLTGLNAKSGITAMAHTPTDSIVLEILKDRVYAFRRDEYEKGTINRDFPLARIPDIESSMSAFSTGIGGATFVSLNRKSGIASLTQTMSMGFFSDGPRIESNYFTCGPRKN